MRNRLVSEKSILLIAGTISIVIFILWKYKAWELVSTQYLRGYTDRIRGLGLLGILLYFLGFTLGTIFCLPSLPFALLAGITYGITMGILYASIGYILGASTTFIIARYVMRESIEKRLKDNKIFNEINKGVQENGWRIVVLTRMVAVIPHSLQNYAYGLTSISFKTYAIVSLICIIPGTTAWIFVINTVGKNKQDAQITMIYLAIAAIVIVVISYLPKFIYNKK